MKVRELMAELIEKDPDDIVELDVKATLYINDKKATTLNHTVTVTDVANGNTPVLLKADLTINVESKVEVY